MSTYATEATVGSTVNNDLFCRGRSGVEILELSIITAVSDVFICDW
jgi:hypothetical protein